MEKSNRVKAGELQEGDRIMLGINLHGSSEGLPGVEYHREVYQAGVLGTVTHLPREEYLEMMDEGKRPMVDIKVETDDGTVYNWNVDNGYVLGPNRHDEGPNRTDVGKIGGLHKPSVA